MLLDQDYEHRDPRLKVPNPKWIARNDHWKSKNNGKFGAERLREKELYGKHWDKDIMMEYDNMMTAKTKIDKKQAIESQKDISSLCTTISSNQTTQILQISQNRLTAASDESKSIEPTKQFPQMPNRFEERAIERQYGISLEDYQEDPVKKYRTAYEIFSDQNIETIKQNYQYLEGSALLRKCAQQWAILTFEQKTTFNKLAQLDKERYEEELKEAPQPLWVIKKKNKMVEDIRKPKRYLTPYNYFIQDMKPKLQLQEPSMAMPQLFQELSKVWGSLSIEEKSKYNQSAEQDKARYQEESECYIRQRMAHKSNKLDPRMQNVQMGALRQPMTGYMIFGRKMREFIKNSGQDLTTKEIMRLIGNKWSQLSLEEKNMYDLQACDDRAQFNQQFNDFRRKMDIDERNGDDTQTLQMLEAEATFSECDENEGVPTQNGTSICTTKMDTGILGNVIPVIRSTNDQLSEIQQKSERCEESRRNYYSKDSNSAKEQEEKEVFDPYGVKESFDQRRQNEEEEFQDRSGFFHHMS